jgi:hypothetical protein
MARKPLKDEEHVPQMIALIREGKSRVQIAIALGWGREQKSRVCGLLHRAKQRGYDIPATSHRKPLAAAAHNRTDPALVARAVELVKEGFSIRQVAAKVGIDRRPIGVALAAAGIEPAPQKVPEPLFSDDQIRALLRAGCTVKETMKRTKAGKPRVRRLRREIVGLPPQQRPQKQVVRMIRSPAQHLLDVIAAPAPPQPPRPVVRVQPAYIGKPRQCEYLIGAEKPWARCEHNIERGSYCKTHARACYSPTARAA